MYRFTLVLALVPVAVMAQVNPNYDPDYNGDGCHTIADLIPFLQVFGGCTDTADVWMCGEALTFDGHQYATTAVGEQCWFAENLRSSHYANGDAILTNISDSAWQDYPATGRMAVYGDGDDCVGYALDLDACDTVQSLVEYGRLYNWYAATDARNLCPIGWHVPSDEDWMALEMAMGMTQEEANIEGLPTERNRGLGWGSRTTHFERKCHRKFGRESRTSNFGCEQFGYASGVLTSKMLGASTIGYMAWYLRMLS